MLLCEQKEIYAGKLREETELTTRKDVAKLAGVSVATVSNVLSNRLAVSEEKAEKVRAAAKQLNYYPNHTARSLSLGQSFHIGVIINEFTNPYHMEIVQYIGKYVTMRGFMMTVFDFKEDADNVYRFLGERQFDALVNFSSNVYTKELLKLLKERGTILVNFANVSDIEVHHDVIGAMLDCMGKLRSLGHTKVGYVSVVDAPRFYADERGATFTSKRKEYGFDENDDYILFNNDFNLESGEIGYTLTKKLMTAHPEITALFVMNDTAAFGAMRALKDLGLNCPADVSVIGCDDIILSSEYIPSLTSISFDKEEYGTEIGKRIIDCIRNGAYYSSDVYVVKAKAIIRESVAKRR